MQFERDGIIYEGISRAVPNQMPDLVDEDIILAMVEFEDVFEPWWIHRTQEALTTLKRYYRNHYQRYVAVYTFKKC